MGRVRGPGGGGTHILAPAFQSLVKCHGLASSVPASETIVPTEGCLTSVVPERFLVATGYGAAGSGVDGRQTPGGGDAADESAAPPETAPAGPSGFPTGVSVPLAFRLAEFHRFREEVLPVMGSEAEPTSLGTPPDCRPGSRDPDDPEPDLDRFGEG